MNVAALEALLNIERCVDKVIAQLEELEQNSIGTESSDVVMIIPRAHG